MKKVIKNQKEIYTVWSDHTGKPFKHNLVPVEVHICFSYGSQYDESEVTLHFTDEEFMPILRLISNKLCEKTKKELKKENEARANTNSKELISLLTNKIKKNKGSSSLSGKTSTNKNKNKASSI